MIIIDNLDGLVSAHDDRLRICTHTGAHTHTHRAYCSLRTLFIPAAVRTAVRNQRICVIPPTDDYHDNKDGEADPPLCITNTDLFL